MNQAAKETGEETDDEAKVLCEEMLCYSWCPYAKMKRNLKKLLGDAKKKPQPELDAFIARQDAGIC